MKLYVDKENYKLYNGSMLDMLEVIEKNSIDSIVTDPPYGLTSIVKRFGKENSAPAQYGNDGAFSRLSKGFMGKEWDGSGIEYNVDAWRKCYEVLKPGGYLLAFGGSRTFHRIACAIEDAGFEIRDTIMWLYGSGFPKSMNIGLAIDKKNGIDNRTGNVVKGVGSNNTNSMKNGLGESQEFKSEYEERKATNEWQGWGTCLKPAYEPIIVARKPFKGSLVDNVIKNGVGGINIDECRVSFNGDSWKTQKSGKSSRAFQSEETTTAGGECVANENGRFPANVILTYDETDFEEVCGGFPSSNKPNGSLTKKYECNNEVYGDMPPRNEFESYQDTGSAARYFMNCKYTGKDEDLWKNLFVNNVENDLETLKAIKDSIVQMNAEELLKELQNHYAKYVENQQELIETPIVLDIVEILSWDFKIETSRVIQDFIGNYNKCIQFQNLVQFVENMDNIDTTQITQNLLKLFGYVKVVITNYILGNVKLEERRYLYTPKASKKDRDEGLELFDSLKVNDGRETQRGESLRKNIHPTVKPVELMQYLVRLVTPKGGTILDCFMGSGSTGKAVMFENRERDANYKFIGIDLTEEYMPICEARIEYALNKYKYEIEKENQEDAENGILNIFDFIEEMN